MADASTTLNSIANDARFEAQSQVPDSVEIFTPTSPANAALGVDIISGRNTDPQFQPYRDAMEVALAGITRGYPDLGMKGFGAEPEPEAYRMPGSPWGIALANSVGRLVQDLEGKGQSSYVASNIEEFGQQIAYDTIMQLEARQALKAIDSGRSPEGYGTFMKQGYDDAVTSKQGMDELKAIAAGDYHEIKKEHQIDLANIMANEGDRLWGNVFVQSQTYAASLRSDGKDIPQATELESRFSSLAFSLTTQPHVPQQHEPLLQATEMAIHGITKGYPALGLHTLDGETDPDQYHRPGSRYNAALNNAVGRQLMSDHYDGGGFENVDLRKLAGEIATDVIGQVEAGHAYNTVKLGFRIDEKDPRTDITDMVEKARNNPSSLDKLHYISTGQYHRLEGADYKKLQETNAANPRLPAVLQVIDEMDVPERIPSFAKNHSYYSGANLLVEAARGKAPDDFDSKMATYRYTPEEAQVMVAAIKIADKLALEHSPSIMTAQNAGIPVPYMERKLERAVDHHMTERMPDDSVEKAALGILAATEAQIQAHVMLNVTSSVQLWENQNLAYPIDKIGNEHPQLYGMAQMLKHNPTERYSLEDQASGLFNQMQVGSEEVFSDLESHANLSKHQRDTAATMANECGIKTEKRMTMGQVLAQSRGQGI